MLFSAKLYKFLPVCKNNNQVFKLKYILATHVHNRNLGASINDIIAF